jgi:D-alanyl-D-alanine carboxypeptidase
MNQKAVSIGMKETFFLNDTGLDTSTTSPGALGSAHDMALLLAYIYATEPDVFQGSAWVSASFISDTRTHKVENTNKISAVIPQVIASKTGFTDLAGGNLAVLYEPTPGRPIAAVILGSTREEREADLLALTESATQELRQSIICSHNGQ